MTVSAFEAFTSSDQPPESARLSEVVPEHVIVNGHVYTLFTPPPLADV